MVDSTEVSHEERSASPVHRDTVDGSQETVVEDNIEKPGKDQFFNGLETLEVDNILDFRNEQDCRQYLVSFKSWIAEEYLQDYNELLIKFWKQKDEEQLQNGNVPKDIPSKDKRSPQTHFAIQEDASTESSSSINIDNQSLSTETVDVERTYESEELLPPSFNRLERKPMTGGIQATELPRLDSSEDTSYEWTLEKENHNVVHKKRKLKSLDDIVRKITKQNDQVIHPAVTEDGLDVMRGYQGHVNFEESVTSEQKHVDEETKRGSLKTVSPELLNGKAETIGESQLTNGKHSPSNAHQEEQSPRKTQQTPAVKSRQRYHKCRYCSTLYSDPALLERHENSHFGRAIAPAPPPLVPVTDEKDAYSRHPHYGKNHRKEDESMIRKPIRNLLSRMCSNPESMNQELLLQKARRNIDIICPLCKVKFNKVLHFQQHFRISHPNTVNFICKGCHIVFLSNEEFENHDCTHVVTRGGYSTPCQRVDSTEFQHNDRAIQPQHHQYRCNLCSRTFNNRYHLNEHLEDHNDGSPPVCQICGKYFERMDSLNSHIIEHHAEMRRVNDRAFNGNRSPCASVTMGNEPRMCSKHGSQHTSPRNSEQSPSRSSSASYDSNEQQPYEPVRMIPTSRHHNENKPSYPYDQNKPITKQRFPEEDYYHPRSLPKEQSHIKPDPFMQLVPSPAQQPPQNAIKVSTPRGGGTPFNQQNGDPSVLICSKCGENFSSPSLYDIHMQSHKELFECEKCHKTFSVRSQYDFHMQSHENSKSHKCPYCHRSFSMKGNLRRHIRIHTNEAPYECPICFQRFRRSDGLKGHIKRHETLGESAPTDLLPSQAS
eukprot:TCONS_00053309-protein